MDPSGLQCPVLSVHGEAGVSNNTTTHVQPHRDHPPISIHWIEPVCSHWADTAPELSGHFAFARDHGEQDVGFQASNLDLLKALRIAVCVRKKGDSFCSRLLLPLRLYKSGETRVMHAVLAVSRSYMQ
jgi:hypothetical protein